METNSIKIMDKRIDNNEPKSIWLLMVVTRRRWNLFILCNGDGGNVICCIPKQDLVVVIASEVMPNARDRWELIVKCILPCIRSNK